MISVIIPLYNKESIIERSLRSVLSQDFDDFEVIVVNDGSTDRSAEIVRSIRDSRIRLIEQGNRGPSAARNTGVKNAKGNWILFLDADDELLCGALKQFNLLITEHGNVNIFVCPFFIQNGYERKLCYQYNTGLIKENFKAHFLGLLLPRTGTCIYTKKLVASCLFNENIKRFEDLDALFRMYKNAIIYLDNQPAMVVNTAYAAASKERKDIREDFVGHLDFNNKSFWERMSLYKLFIEERSYYLKQMKELYPQLFHRYDMFIIYKLIGWTKRNRFLWNTYLRLSGFSQFIK